MSAQQTPRQIAEKIVEHLFRVGGMPPNEEADQLKLYQGDRYLAGWGREPAADAIERILEESHD